MDVRVVTARQFNLGIEALEAVGCLEYLVDVSAFGMANLPLADGYGIDYRALGDLLCKAKEAMGCKRLRIFVGREHSPVLYVEFPNGDFERLVEAWGEGLEEIAKETEAQEYWPLEKVRGQAWCGFRLWWD